jgi:hypothetical protein
VTRNTLVSSCALIVTRYVTPLRRLGIPAADVVAIARETGADLIVLAWSQYLNPGRAQVVSETLAHSDIAVLLCPLGERRRGPCQLSRSPQED